MDYRQEIRSLQEELNQHGYRYYVLDDPVISDYEYDRKLRRRPHPHNEVLVLHPGEDIALIKPLPPARVLTAQGLEQTLPLSRECQPSLRKVATGNTEAVVEH